MCRTVLSKLQKTIVKDARDDSPEAGDLRTRQVAIGAENRPVTEARFMPPPPGNVLVEGVSDWEKWVNAENDVPIIIKMALAHYQFETLHPYHNGNGRLGRLVAILQLVESGELALPIINLSFYLELYKDAYQDHLLSVSESGKFDSWIEFFSTAMERQAIEAVTAIEELTAFKNQTINSLRRDGLSGTIIELVELRIGYPAIDVATVCTILGKSQESSNNVVSKLVDRGILRKATGQKVNRNFICPKAHRITSPYRLSHTGPVTSRRDPSPYRRP
nr:Fic family protein [Natronoglycomyces albus]